MPYTQNCLYITQLHQGLLPVAFINYTRPSTMFYWVLRAMLIATVKKFSHTISTPQTKQNKKIFHATSATASYKRFWEKCREPVRVVVVDDKQEKLQVGHGWFYPAVPNTALINSLWGVVVYLCVETCPVVSAHTKGAHIWPLYRLQQTNTPTSGGLLKPQNKQNLKGWSSLWDWHLKHVAHCRKLSSTSSFWQLSPIQMSPPYIVAIH